MMSAHETVESSKILLTCNIKASDIEKRCKSVMGMTNTPTNLAWVNPLSEYTEQVCDRLPQLIENDMGAECGTEAVIKLTTEDFETWLKAMASTHKGKTPSQRGEELMKTALVHYLYMALMCCIVGEAGSDWCENAIATLEDRIDTLREKESDKAQDKADELEEKKGAVEEVYDEVAGNDAYESVMQAILGGDLEEVLNALEAGDFHLDVKTDA